MILHVLKENRNEKSFVAGGYMLHLYGSRLSGDLDIFYKNTTEQENAFQKDISLLQKKDFYVDDIKTNIIHKEYKVYKEGEYPVTLQYSAFNEPTFFPLIKDGDIIRLHIIDLAINKCCAFVERTVERDYYDMIFIHNNIIPLWHLFCATSYRLQDFNPFSLAEFFDKKLRFEKFNFSNLENSLIEYVSEKDLKTSFKNIITDTKNNLDTVRKNIVLREHIGHIMLDDNNIIINPNSLPNKITCLDLQKKTCIVENEPIDTKIMNDIKNNFPDNGYTM